MSCDTIYRDLDCGCGCLLPGVSFTFDLSGIAPDDDLKVLDPCGHAICVEDGDIVDVYGGVYPQKLVESGYGVITP